MELYLAEQRSPSQGSLHSTYQAPSRSTALSQQARPTKRGPLRSIDDNVTFLRSPGPLESMLKTTTETGDIGLFSIKPAVSPATYHQPARSRPSPGDPQILTATRLRLGNFDYVNDDRRRLPSSYRDTTSEIISLYRADTQPHSISLFPIEDGHRTYSLTMSSSRHIPSHKSTCTLHSQSSGAGLHRPRSPFPYRTRLKRPGVRPASPALTDSELIDYARVIELNRASQVS
jgi:hypothetical protein